jgi:uncharacterized lipoprotein YehR (DUF1307 family)
MEGMKTLRTLLVISILSISLTGCANKYRYECQDPANWELEACNPPECLGYSECVNDIYGFDPREVTK